MRTFGVLRGDDSRYRRRRLHRGCVGRQHHGDEGSAARSGASFATAACSVRHALGLCSHGLSADLVRHHGLRHD
jgi:hypothetical protein